ncbi:unnamed protein product [Symbiodinium sp. CCMP2592]|nr:unnamed protein product [Symbiodinium sp. CCMP2592]
MSEDVRAAVGKMSRVLRIAKDRANTQFGKVRERAKRFSLSGSQAAASASQSGAPSDEALPADLDKVRQLTDFGFSEVAARHALRLAKPQIAQDKTRDKIAQRFIPPRRACAGRLDLAGPWLPGASPHVATLQRLDEANADEVLAAEARGSAGGCIEIWPKLKQTLHAGEAGRNGSVPQKYESPALAVGGRARAAN